MFNPSKSRILILLFLLTTANVYSQSCGFGCLGLSGFFGGYTYHSYEAGGFNDYLNKQFAENLGKKIPEFNTGKGFRVGANFFRAKFDNFFFSAKGFYQFLDEEHSINSEQTSFANRYNYKLQADHFGIGVDFGIPLFKFLDWKIIEGGVNVFRSEINVEVYRLEELVDEVEYEGSEHDVGYYVGSGLIVHLVKDYVSIEGTAGYNFFEVENVEDQNKNLLLSEESKNLIDKSGFSATVQINLGFPL